jgi:hypothetical protein
VFTLFHLFVLLGIGTGLALGIAGGAKLFGFGGGVVGALAGGYAGFIIGRLPELWVMRSLARRLISKPSGELRAYLRQPDCLIPNIVLLELERRGEDISQELGVVLDLLVSEDATRRGHGWAALDSAFPEHARQIPDYRVGDTVEDCRRKTERLRNKK